MHERVFRSWSRRLDIVFVDICIDSKPPEQAATYVRIDEATTSQECNDSTHKVNREASQAFLMMPHYAAKNKESE